MDNVWSGMFAWLTMIDQLCIPAPVLTELRAIVGPENLRLAAGELAVYARDATPLIRGMPDAVIASTASRSYRAAPAPISARARYHLTAASY
jgi:hypothetical protein